MDVAVGRPGRRERHVGRHRDALEEAAPSRREDEELAPALLPAEDRDAVAVRREGEVAAALGARGEVLADDVLVLRRVPGREVLVELSVAHGQQRDVHVVLVGRERRDEVPGRRRRRADLEGLAPGGSADAEALAVFRGLALGGEERQVLPPEVAAKLQVEVVGLDLESAPEGDGDVASEERPVLEEEVPHRVLSPLGLHEVVNRVAVPVGRVAFDRDLRDRRDEILVDRVPQEHPVLVVLVVAVIRRHALHDPGRNVRRQRAAEPSAEQDLVLEDVRQLVLDEGLELLVGKIDGKHHAVSRRLGEGADAFGDEVELDVVLLEFGMRCVIDDRHALRDLVVQPARQLVVRGFRHRDDLLEGLALARVVEDVEVRGLVDRPVELVVDDLVLTGGEERGREREDS